MDLTALQHSIFLQSLGWAIANSLWQAAALWIFYYLVNGSYKNASAKLKNTLSTLLLFSIFIWFCITLMNRYFLLQRMSLISSSNLLNPTWSFLTGEINNNWNKLLNGITICLPYLSVAYLLLLFFLAIRLINSYRFTYFIKTNGLQKPSALWKVFTQKVACQMGIAKKITLWVSDHIDVPATIGFVKPVILIPMASVNSLTTDQLEAIILHELSHIKRNDFLINLFMSLIETILFFNPFVVLLAKIIKRERENCCDDFVIQYQYDRHSYASALLSLEQLRNINLRLAVTATSGKKQLLERIKRIMEIKRSTHFNYGQKLLALLLITGIFCSLAWLSPNNETNSNNWGNKTLNSPSERKIVIERLKQSILSNSNDTTNNIVFNFQTKRYSPENKRFNGIPSANRENKNVNEFSNNNKGESAPNDFSENNFDNGFLTAQPPRSTPMSFGNSKAEDHKEKTQGNLSFNHNLSEVKDIKTRQSVVEKNQYSILFKTGQIQHEISHTINGLRINMRTPARLNENSIEGKIDGLLNSSIKNVEVKNLKNIYVFLRGLNENNTHLDNVFPGNIDSLLTRKASKLRVEISNKGAVNSKLFKEKPVSLAIPYSINNNDSEKPGIPLKQGTSHSSKVSFEYRNGEMIINGEKIGLPHNSRMVALLKAKHLFFSTDNPLLEIQAKD